MPLVVGTDCSLSVGSKVFDNVVNSFELSFDTDSITYDTLAGPRAAGGSESGELSITFAYDSADTDSLFDVLWNAAGTTLAYVATVGGSTFSGNAISVRPSAPATAGSVSEVQVALPLDGIPTKGAVVKAATSNSNP